MLQLFEARSIGDLKSDINGFLSSHSDLEITAISHCNVVGTGPLGGFKLWNALVYFKPKK